MENLVESDGSNSDSGMNIVSEGEIDEEDHDRATVDAASFERVRGQLGDNVAENAECHILRTFTANEMEFNQNIRIDVYYNSTKFQLHMLCLCY